MCIQELLLLWNTGHLKMYPQTANTFQELQCLMQFEGTCFKTRQQFASLIFELISASACHNMVVQAFDTPNINDNVQIVNIHRHHSQFEYVTNAVIVTIAILASAGVAIEQNGT